jgi:hypothetical protein
MSILKRRPATIKLPQRMRLAQWYQLESIFAFIVLIWRNIHTDHRKTEAELKQKGRTDATG